MAELPIFAFDAHVDSLQLALDLGRDLGVAGRGHFDLERAKAGGLAAVVLVCWTDPAYLARGPGAARERTRALLGAFQRTLERCPDRLHFAGSGAALARARAAGAVAGIPGIEGGHALEDGLADLEWFFEHGVRVLTLCWNNHLPWIRSCRDGAGPGVPRGLSAEGRAIVARMNELGVLVDLSHAGERSFFDALEASKQPVIASHSACRALSDHPRNLTDAQLAALGAQGGVVGIPFCTAFLDRAAGAEDERLRASAAYRELAAANDTELNWLQGEFLQERAAPLALECVVEHVLHALEHAGSGHVGIGSDFDGIQRRPAGLEDASRYGELARALAARGLAQAEIEGVLGANLERVYASATGPGTAAAHAELRAFAGAG